MDYSFKIKMISDHLHTNFQKFEFGEIVYAHQGSIYLIKNTVNSNIMKYYNLK